MKILINNIKRFLKSFVYAFCGITNVIKNERNFRFHIAFAILTIILGIIADITDTQFIAIIICISVVLGFELINTSIESICDEISKEKRNNIKIAKDSAAGAVLICAVLSIIIGLRIFVKYEYISSIFNFFSEIKNLFMLVAYIILSFIFVFLPNNKKE